MAYAVVANGVGVLGATVVPAPEPEPVKNTTCLTNKVMAVNAIITNVNFKQLKPQSSKSYTKTIGINNNDNKTGLRQHVFQNK